MCRSLPFVRHWNRDMEVGNLRIRIEITSSRNLAWSVSKRSLVTHTLYNDRKSNNSTSLKRIMAMPWTKKKVHYSGIRPASSHTKIHGRFACAQCMRLAGIELSRPCGSLQWLSSFNPRQANLLWAVHHSQIMAWGLRQ